MTGPLTRLTCLLFLFVTIGTASQLRGEVVARVGDDEQVRCEKCGRVHGAKRVVDPLRRTGHPFDIAPWAVVTPTRHNAGYYVGGGAAIGGGRPTPDEGVWGVDYVRLLFRKRVDLNWWHGRHKQGGSGAYKSNGPHLLPGH